MQGTQIAGKLIQVCTQITIHKPTNWWSATTKHCSDPLSSWSTKSNTTGMSTLMEFCWLTGQLSKAYPVHYIWADVLQVCTRNITTKKYELILHITIVCMHDVSEICMALCIRLYVTQHLFYYYRSFNQELNSDTTTQQCQRIGGKGTSWPSDGLGLTRTQNTMGRECVDCLI